MKYVYAKGDLKLVNITLTNTGFKVCLNISFYLWQPLETLLGKHIEPSSVYLVYLDIETKIIVFSGVTNREIPLDLHIRSPE